MLSLLLRLPPFVCGAALVLAACGSSSESPEPPTPCVPPAAGTAPTFSQLYTQYFATGTPGHCANAGCHGQPSFNIWLCGADKSTCYDGMVDAGIIDPDDPTASRIADMRNSPLRWVNPNGPMPQDAAIANTAGRDAILAWTAACAQND